MAQDNAYDAIVVGTGIYGRVGRQGAHRKRPEDAWCSSADAWSSTATTPRATKDPWEYAASAAAAPHEDRAAQARAGAHRLSSRQRTSTGSSTTSSNPYTEVKRFDWFRGYHVGGRSLMWGRQSYRCSDLDFEANAKEGIAIDWPIRYADIAPWYDHVETPRRASPDRPKGCRSCPTASSSRRCRSTASRSRLAAGAWPSKFERRARSSGRVANLTAPLAAQPQRGTLPVPQRVLAGCPYGAYFSTQSSTLPAAEATGRHDAEDLRDRRPKSIYDRQRKRATGVRVMDAETGAHDGVLGEGRVPLRVDARQLGAADATRRPTSGPAGSAAVAASSATT